MRRYLVDGRFLASLTTGVDRYANEVLKELDEILGEEKEHILKENNTKENNTKEKNLENAHTGKIKVSILVPSSVKKLPEYKNIKVIQSHFSKYWTQLVFAANVWIHRAIPVNLCNEVSILAPKGICALHDVCYAETEEYSKHFNYSEEEKQWFLKIYKRIASHSKNVITVSEFSKERIVKLIGIEPEKITVAGNGWQHFENVVMDDTIFERFPHIRKGEYFFTMSSANSNKNVAWVIENAKKNKDKQYVIGGKNIDKVYDLSECNNIVYVGFLKDGEAKSLMKNCKAFVFPSYYEGFGIPPLEAASTGADIIVAKAASLPEIFGDCAHYIDPCNPNADIDQILSEPVKSAENVLKKHTWRAAAQKLYLLLCQ